MAITYPLTLPASPFFRQVELTMNNIVGQSVSEFTGQQQVQLWPGELWAAKLSVAPGTRSVMEAWVTFLAALRGSYGTFLLGDPSGSAPRGIATGTPLVNGAGQTGLTLATDGWIINKTGILLAGDYIQIGSGLTQRLYKNLTDANSNASGQATLDLWPRLRESPADNAPITLINTKGVFRLSGNSRSWTYDAAKIYTLSFSAIEAI